jgi:hypothetical protein
VGEAAEEEEDEAAVEADASEVAVESAVEADWAVALIPSDHPQALAVHPRSLRGLCRLGQARGHTG